MAKSETRGRIVEAAERVMRTKGLARSTTKEIAREAGYSEGTIYKHFESKEDLFISVLTESLPPFVEIIFSLSGRVGGEPLEETLEEVAESALDFYGESFALSASIFSEPELLSRHRAEIRRKNSGPQRVNEALAAYLEAEKNLGSVRADADAKAAAAMLVGACFQRAFFKNFWAEENAAEDRRFTKNIVRTLMRSLSSNDERS